MSERNINIDLCGIHKLLRLPVGHGFTEADVKKLTAMFSVIAQKESESIFRNMRRSYQHRMKNGTFLPSSVPFGYMIQGREIVVNEEQAAVVRRIFHCDGYPPSLSGEESRRAPKVLCKVHPSAYHRKRKFSRRPGAEKQAE